MASEKKTSKTEKTVDLPPYGPRNPDPISDQPGAHPIETGVGAAVSGAAVGAIAGALGGPPGVIIGGIVGGALAGGLAGKGVGEWIDPTTEDTWLREYVARDNVDADTYRPAYRYGVEAGCRNCGKRWEEIEPDLRAGWEQRGGSDLTWDEAHPAVRDAYHRTSHLYAERMRQQADSVTVSAGSAEVVVQGEPIEKRKM